LARELATELKRAKRAVVARDLHAAVVRLRLLYDAPGMTPSDLGSLAERCLAIWNRRNSLVGMEDADLTPALEQQIQLDLLDLALLWTDFHVRQALPDTLDAARREGLSMLGEADGLFGPSPVLARRERELAEALGLQDQAAEAERRAAQLPPRSAWDHVALGRSLLHRAAFEQASVEFKKAFDLEPKEFWPNFYAGVCAYRQENHYKALADFHACVTLASETPECWYNRALAWTALGDTEQAVRDYDRALRLDPSFAAATLNRGVLHWQNKNLDLAKADLQNALILKADPAVVNYNLALVYRADKDHDAALTHLRQALKYNPHHREALELCEQLEGKVK
jgi:tetratricopeptide (TPR) repeat protein